jgi:ABC-2 type transport system ATP-binding protein
VDKGHEHVETPVQEESSAAEADARWGSGEARLTGVRLLDADGRPATLFRTGDPVTVRMEYQCTTRVERPVFGLAMENLDGVYVWAHNTRDAGLELAFIEGRGYVDLQIPRLMLQPHTFDLIASIVDHTTTHTYDFLRHCYRFAVEPEPGSPRESGGILALGGRWHAGDTVALAPEAIP